MRKLIPSGFTLLEMLVVLTIIGLLAGLALPSVGRMMSSFQLATQWREVESDLNGLALRALNDGAALVLTNESAPTLITSLPSDWQVRTVKAIHYQSSGWCGGGQVQITSAEGETRTYELVAPRCAVGGR